MLYSIKLYVGIKLSKSFALSTCVLSFTSVMQSVNGAQLLNIVCFLNLSAALAELSASALTAVTVPLTSKYASP